MGLAPQAQESPKGFAKSEFRQSDRSQLFQNSAVELLKRIDLFEDGAAMLSQRLRVSFANVRKPHQSAGMRAQRKKIRSELVMQFPRDLLALQILKRNRAFGETAFFLHRVSQGGRNAVQFAADRSQF